MKTAKQNLVMFFGVAVMWVGVMINCMLLIQISIPLIDIYQLSNVAQWSVLFTLIGGVGLLFMTMRGSIRTGFHILFPIHLAFLIAYLLGASEIHQVFGNIFYLWGSFSAVVLPAFVWGYANQVFQFRSAALFYPLIGIIGGIFSKAFLMYASYFEETFQVMILAVGTGLSYAIFLFLSSMELGPKDAGRKINWGYWLALALFALGVWFAPQYQQILFKWQAKQLFPNLLEYTQIMGEYYYQLLMVCFVGSLGSIGIGILYYFTGSKWWGRVSMTLIGCVLITSLIYFFTSQIVRLSDLSLLLLSYGTVVIGTLFVMLTGLKELAYFAIPLDKRFTAKCFIEIILLPLSVAFATEVTSFIHSRGEFGFQVIPLGALCIGGLLIALVGIIKIGSDFRKAPKIAT